MPIVVYAIPFFLITLLLEWRVTARRGLLGYQSKDAFASLTMGLVNMLLVLGVKTVHLAFFFWLYQYRIFTFDPAVWWSWPLLIVAEDFCYYWFHRSHHEVRMLWAAHENHHSSTRYNLSTALRQSWTTPITGPIFWAPLPLLGFHPAMVIIAQGVSLIYQYWIHTELIERMGPFELLFNTPSHHRVHHGRNPRYLDRNHGGILIVWDRLFGTFEPEREKVEYGLTKNIDTYNPLRIAFHEWGTMLREAFGAKTLRGALGYLFMPPGWREDGTGKTARDLRAEVTR